MEALGDLYHALPRIFPRSTKTPQLQVGAIDRTNHSHDDRTSLACVFFSRAGFHKLLDLENILAILYGGQKAPLESLAIKQSLQIFLTMLLGRKVAVFNA